ncbi:MAG: hypothetical protein K0R61_123 [Microvirga sp.]|jgi:hypothetical protein|nr:hypothetical protein [Microvirga sp.]
MELSREENLEFLLLAELIKSWPDMDPIRWLPNVSGKVLEQARAFQAGVLETREGFEKAMARLTQTAPAAEAED